MASYGFKNDKAKSDKTIETMIEEAVNTATTNLQNQINNMWSRIYPVGSIYISTTTEYPGALFGGTWEAYALGRTLVGFTSGDNAFKTMGFQGGVKATPYTPTGTVANHALRLSEIPDHTHWENADVAAAQSGSGVNAFNFNVGGELYTKGIKASAGSIFGQPHNHNFVGNATNINTLQPYVVVKIWRRTA